MATPHNELKRLVNARVRPDLPEFNVDKNAMREYRLYEEEFFWRDHYIWLKEKGYLLRPRYMPDWVASWKNSDQNWRRCEDGQAGDVRKTDYDRRTLN